MANAFKDKNAFENESLWSKLFFNWVRPVLKHAKKH